MTFEDAYRVLARLEGGEVNDPADRGGHTNLGVTQRAYSRYRDRKGLPARSVALIEREEALELYREDYWEAGSCDELPSPLNAVHFDACVHHGPAGAGRLLQDALGVTVDGIIGPETLGAVGALPVSGIRKLCEDQLWLRVGLLSEIVERDPTQLRFFRGWINRLHLLRTSVLA